ncbi:MAG: V-type ATP synthase subunit A [Alphaproteobacteria bacterium]
MSRARERAATLSTGTIVRLRGPVLEAESPDGFRMTEAVFAGPRRLLGEVLRVEGNRALVQVYEDTTGLKPGDRVERSGQSFSVPLGPGLLGGIYDGLLRPLRGTGSIFVRPGMSAPAEREFAFTPEVEPGGELRPGQAFGAAQAEHGLPEKCLVPPGVSGTVEEVAEAGNYGGDAPLCQVRTASGERVALSGRQDWPVREPRPVAERLASDAPLITGQRIIDGLFTIARGGKAAMPGGFGTGKTILQQSLAKWCDADVIVFIGCGERGNEMTALLHEFPDLEDPRTGRPLLERSVIIANTSNMPVAAREASIYTGVTVAEYFRDQGFHVALMADSTSRWAEALREIAGQMGVLPTEGGFPAYLASRLADFYERAGYVRSLSGEEGSVTIIGAISPPGGDFSEPVTLHTQRNAGTFWPLDRNRARARFYPAISPLQAYSMDADEMRGWWRARGHAERPRIRRRFLGLMEQQARLERMARILGREALPPEQQLVLLASELIDDCFLRQNAFHPVDRFTSPERQARMMEILDTLIDAAERAVQAGADVQKIAELPLMRRLRRMGEEISDEDTEAFARLHSQIDRAFAELREEAERQGEGAA